MAITAFCIPPPRTPATARANTSEGKARNKSEIRIKTESNAPPFMPHKMPIAVPKNAVAKTINKVPYILILLPAITLENISLP